MDGFVDGDGDGFENGEGPYLKHVFKLRPLTVFRTVPIKVDRTVSFYSAPRYTPITTIRTASSTALTAVNQYSFPLILTAPQ